MFPNDCHDSLGVCCWLLGVTSNQKMSNEHAKNTIVTDEEFPTNLKTIKKKVKRKLFLELKCIADGLIISTNTFCGIHNSVSVTSVLGECLLDIFDLKSSRQHTSKLWQSRRGTPCL